jgi:signal transduction histidine kinase
MTKDDSNPPGRGFLQDLAHDLSTPLTPLAGYLKILCSGKLGPLNEAQKKVVDAMATSAVRLARLVDNLADFANLDGEAAPIATAPVDPDALAAAVVEDYQAASKERRINIVVAPSRGGAVQADARKLKQALENLVASSVKVSPHGGEILVEVARLPGRGGTPEMLQLAVYDQGPGVDPDRAFEPYSKPAGVSGEVTGSGLRLPVARKIAEAHGGRAYAESPPLNQPSGGERIFSGSKLVIEIPVGAVEGRLQQTSGVGPRALDA